MRLDKFDNINQVKDFCKVFDHENNTKTYFTELSLQEIRNVVKGDQYGQYEYLRTIIAQTFSFEKKVYSNDPRLNRSHIGKLNSFYLMTNDIRTGKKFYSPMSLSIMPDGHKILHPGRTRLLYSEIYSDVVQIMITDYSNLNLDYKPCDLFWDPEVQVLYSSHGHDYNDPYVSSHFRKYPVAFKTITDHRLDTDKLSYHDPTQVSPPRCFELIKNCVYINGDLILKQKGKYWRLVL